MQAKLAETDLWTVLSFGIRNVCRPELKAERGVQRAFPASGRQEARNDAENPATGLEMPRMGVCAGKLERYSIGGHHAYEIENTGLESVPRPPLA